MNLKTWKEEHMFMSIVCAAVLMTLIITILLTAHSKMSEPEERKYPSMTFVLSADFSEMSRAVTVTTNKENLNVDETKARDTQKD